MEYCHYYYVFFCAITFILFLIYPYEFTYES
jgi:hypothetical protein